MSPGVIISPLVVILLYQLEDFYEYSLYYQFLLLAWKVGVDSHLQVIGTGSVQITAEGPSNEQRSVHNVNCASRIMYFSPWTKQVLLNDVTHSCTERISCQLHLIPVEKDFILITFGGCVVVCGWSINNREKLMARWDFIDCFVHVKGMMVECLELEALWMVLLIIYGH